MDYFYENRASLLNDNSPLSVYLNDNFSYMAHWHTEIEIAFVDFGSIFIGINNDRRKLTQGDIAICTGGDIHYYESADPNARIIVLIFKPEFFGFAADWPFPQQLVSPFLQKKDIEQSHLESLQYHIRSILEEKHAQKNYYEIFLKAKIIELCGCILRYIPAYDASIKNSGKTFSKLKTMQDILVYIENNYSEDLSLEALACRFNLDSYNLSKAFNSITGTNLKTYINTLRVSKAENIIASGNKPLTDIALECGFNSIRTFNRAFKNIKGYAPSSLR